MQIEIKVVNGTCILKCNGCKGVIENNNCISTYKKDTGYKMYHNYECFFRTGEENR